MNDNDFLEMIRNDCSKVNSGLFEDDDYWEDLDAMSDQICCID